MFPLHLVKNSFRFFLSEYKTKIHKCTLNFRSYAKHALKVTDQSAQYLAGLNPA